tara:strand:- start:46 stop:432 length:387 start_codon:yes stop_codon:yes gene_type:complete
MKDEIKKWQNLLEELLVKKPEIISNIAKNKQIQDEGVYVISKPKKIEDIVYVGKTRTLSIQRRMYDHLSHKHGDTDSDLANMVIARSHLPQDYENYLVRFVALENPRDRMRFENFVISILDPELNKTG